MKKIILSLTITATFFALLSCSKEPGEGGKASIFGKVKINNYNANFTILQASYYAQEENVFIIYGDDKTYSKSVKTNYDGTYEFPYLRTGKYTVYAYSKDTIKYNGNIIASKTVEVLKTVEITGKKDIIEVPELVIVK